MSNSLTRLRPVFLAQCILAALSPLAASAADVHPRVLSQAVSEGEVDALLVFADQTRPLLAPLSESADIRVHRRALVDALRARAETNQRSVRNWLDEHGIAHRDFWIANLIQARVPLSMLNDLAARTDVARVDPNPAIAMHQPDVEAITAVDPAAGIGWGVSNVEAPLMWAAGFTGQGVVVGGEDTGYQWTHPAIKSQYRGWNGTAADHNYNWHDAVHAPVGGGTNPCGYDQVAPCDDQGHGTHTAGTMVGDDGPSAPTRHQIGVAPGARWIGCRNMDANNGTPARYIECMQWMLAPTDLNNANPNPDLAPDVINNSWYCAVSEGCATGNEIQGAVNNLVNAGIFYAAAAGNGGSACQTIAGPPAIYDASFVVGAIDSGHNLAGFSSRGPVGGSMKTRPDVSAPGVAVYSSIPNNIYGAASGTSMATPHVVGSVALLLSAFPALKGHPETVAHMLRVTATRDVIDPVIQSCGGTAITDWPNYMAGYGRVDAWNAYDMIFIDGFDR